MYFDINRNVGEHIPIFNTREIEKVVYNSPNGKAAGLDGVVYEDIKKAWFQDSGGICKIFNNVLINKRIPAEWKVALIQRIPKKNFNREDLTTMRDISLTLTLYKIFSKCLCERILPYITKEIAFWQRAYMDKRDRQELIFNLMTEIDDFLHISTKIYIAFVDFEDAFGSVSHEFIFGTLEHFSIPYTYCVLIEDLYKYSSFKVICDGCLSSMFYIAKGTKTGDPLSAFIFVMVIDRIFKPMVNVALINKNLEEEKLLNPLPVQGYADDVAIVTYSEVLMQNMIEVAEPIMKDSGLKVKISKCGLFYERRSGNNWYKGKGDRRPVIKIQNQTIPVLKRNETYLYLGKLLNINGQADKQVSEMVEIFKILTEKVKRCMLPLSLKISAMNYYFIISLFNVGLQDSFVYKIR